MKSERRWRYRLHKPLRQLKDLDFYSWSLNNLGKGWNADPPQAVENSSITSSWPLLFLVPPIFASTDSTNPERVVLSIYDWKKSTIQTCIL